jgi:t-SNARE complex subunit (syntaxin)
MQPSRNTSGGDASNAVSEARALADLIGLERSIAKANQLADLVALERSIAKATELVDQIDERRISHP